MGFWSSKIERTSSSMSDDSTDEVSGTEKFLNNIELGVRRETDAITSPFSMPE